MLPHCILNDSYFVVTFKKNRISENRVLADIINDIILNKDDACTQELNAADLKESENVQMKAYRGVPLNDLVALFKHDSGKFYYLLDTNKTLLENFTRKTIVEYPTIVVILRHLLKDYVIQDETTKG